MEVKHMSSESESVKMAIIGGGIAGLTAAYYLAKRGVNVSVFEKEKALGGLASSFLLDGEHIERFYHFICLNDYPLLDLLKIVFCDFQFLIRCLPVVVVHLVFCKGQSL